MSVLLVAPDGLVRRGLERQFRERQRLYDVVADAAAATTAIEAAAGRYVLVLDATLPSVLQHGAQTVFDVDAQRPLWHCAADHDLVLLVLSDGRVYDGGVLPDWPESEAPKPGSRTGASIVAAEKAIAKAAPRHVILRLGSIFGESGDNPLTRILSSLRAGEELPLGNAVKTAPTHVDDVARVTSGMVDQLLVGADCTGVYHYNSSSAVTPLEFAEVIYAHTGQHVDLSSVAPTLKPCQRDSLFTPLVPVLRCQRVLDDFGIKRLPWRSWLPMAVKNLCEDQTK